MDINKTLAEEFKLRQEQIDNTVALLDDDKTIPFIARYRKELTGSLDDQVLREIADRLTYLRNLEKRKGEIISSTDASTLIISFPDAPALLSKMQRPLWRWRISTDLSSRSVKQGLRWQEKRGLNHWLNLS